jgi:hypothetical protein
MGFLRGLRWQANAVVLKNGIAGIAGHAEQPPAKSVNRYRIAMIIPTGYRGMKCYR